MCNYLTDEKEVSASFVYDCASCASTSTARANSKGLNSFNRIFMSLLWDMPGSSVGCARKAIWDAIGRIPVRVRNVPEMSSHPNAPRYVLMMSLCRLDRVLVALRCFKRSSSVKDNHPDDGSNLNLPTPMAGGRRGSNSSFLEVFPSHPTPPPTPTPQEEHPNNAIHAQTHHPECC